MSAGGAIVTIVPAKRNYIPIMPVKDQRGTTCLTLLV